MAVLPSEQSSPKPTSSTHDKPPIHVLVTGYGPFLADSDKNSSWEIALRLPTTLSATTFCPHPIVIHVPHEPLRVAYKYVVETVPPMLQAVPAVTSSSTSNTTSNSITTDPPPSATTNTASDASPPPTPSSQPTQPSPSLVIHIGLAPGRSFYTLESHASRGPYTQFRDVDGQFFAPHDGGDAVFGAHSPFVLRTSVDTRDVWRRWGREVFGPGDGAGGATGDGEAGNEWDRYPRRRRGGLTVAGGAGRRPPVDLRTGTVDSVGRYLCGFVYYLSLSWFWRRKASVAGSTSSSSPEDGGDTGESGDTSGERPVVFLHVPDLPKDDDIKEGVDVAVGLIRALVASKFGGADIDESEQVKMVQESEMDVIKAAKRKEVRYSSQVQFEL